MQSQLLSKGHVILAAIGATALFGALPFVASADTVTYAASPGAASYSSADGDAALSYSSTPAAAALAASQDNMGFYNHGNNGWWDNNGNWHHGSVGNSGYSDNSDDRNHDRSCRRWNNDDDAASLGMSINNLVNQYLDEFNVNGMSNTDNHHANSWQRCHSGNMHDHGNGDWWDDNGHSGWWDNNGNWHSGNGNNNGNSGWWDDNGYWHNGNQNHNSYGGNVVSGSDNSISGSRTGGNVISGYNNSVDR